TDTILSFDREFGLKGKRVKSLLVDAKNKIWIGTRNGLGCLSFNGFNSSTKTHATSNYKLQWYQEENGLSNDRIRCLYEDRSKALWIGTYFGGLSKFFNNSFKLYTKEDGITTNAVNTVQYHPADSALWVGTHGGGLKVFADTEWDLTADKGLSNNTITCFKLYKTGEALVGTEEGLNLIIDKQVVRVWDDYDSFFEGKKITHLAATDSHALLLTDKHKLIALKTISGFSYDEQITKKLVELLGQDVFAVSKAGNQFWVSNNDHLHSFKISQNEIQDFRSWEIKNSDGIAGNKKTKLGYTSDDHLYVIRDGRVEWFDTLHKYHDIKFLIEGTLNDKVSSFWIGVNKGVVNITMQGVKILSRKKYTIDEGFMGVQSFKNSAGKNFDGSIYIGTVKGLLKIEPEAYQGVKRNLKVSLQGMLFEGDQVDLSPFTTGSKDGIPIGLQLPYNMDNITFQVSAIHLKNPKEVKYKYMLKGWDKEFRIKTAQESKGEGNIFHVDYDHIAAGHYEFIAYAKTPCGEWSKNPLVVSLEITPVWWKNAIYITTVVLLSIGLLVFVIISRTRRLIREKEKLEELVVHRTKDLHSEKQKSDDLLLNILPVEIAAELKQFGSAKTKSHVSASVLFTDFEGFTHLSMELTAEELVQRLDEIFVEFDDVIERNRLEKIKTIGDAYMCASGVPESNPHQEINIVIAGLQLLEVMNRFNQKQVASNKPEWNVRVGIHTGELIAGVVGKKKFAYDVWGDTVNIASRMESSGEVGKVNVSESTYEIVKSYFDFEKRGKVAAKNKGELDMYFISGIKEDYQKDNLFTPSEKLYL
ncbi:MAG: class 3 adenylate cyclase, partial [Saprospiraceae bacterium]